MPLVELDFNLNSFAFTPAVVLTRAEHEETGEPCDAWALQLMVGPFSITLIWGATRAD